MLAATPKNPAPSNGECRNALFMDSGGIFKICQKPSPPMSRKKLPSSVVKFTVVFRPKKALSASPVKRIGSSQMPMPKSFTSPLLSSLPTTPRLLVRVRKKSAAKSAKSTPATSCEIDFGRSISTFGIFGKSGMLRRTLVRVFLLLVMGDAKTLDVLWQNLKQVESYKVKKQL